VLSMGKQSLFPSSSPILRLVPLPTALRFRQWKAVGSRSYKWSKIASSGDILFISVGTPSRSAMISLARAEAFFYKVAKACLWSLSCCALRDLTSISSERFSA
jgi:hypothetical protein